MVEHPGGSITDRQTRSEADWHVVGFMLPKLSHLAKISESLWCLQPLPRGSRWDRRETCAFSNRQLDTRLDTPSFTLLCLLGKALHASEPVPAEREAG